MNHDNVLTEFDRLVYQALKDSGRGWNEEKMCIALVIDKKTLLRTLRRLSKINKIYCVMGWWFAN